MSDDEFPLETVLVMDDEPQLLKLMVRILERTGCHVIPVESGDQALKLIEEQGARLDAAVLDMAIVPHGAGEVMEALVSKRADLGVVIASGDVLEPHLRQPLEACRGLFLRKPFTPKALVGAVREAAIAARSAGSA